jgi:hypothetical protein
MCVCVLNVCPCSCLFSFFSFLFTFYFQIIMCGAFGSFQMCEDKVSVSRFFYSIKLASAVFLLSSFLLFFNMCLLVVGIVGIIPKGKRKGGRGGRGVDEIYITCIHTACKVYILLCCPFYTYLDVRRVFFNDTVILYGITCSFSYRLACVRVSMN